MSSGRREFSSWFACLTYGHIRNCVYMGLANWGRVGKSKCVKDRAINDILAMAKLYNVGILQYL